MRNNPSRRRRWSPAGWRANRAPDRAPAARRRRAAAGPSTEHGDQVTADGAGEHAPNRRDGDRDASSASADHGRPRGAGQRQHERARDEDHVQPTCRVVAEAHGERALARRGVGRDVAQVVDHQQGAGQAADAARRRPREPHGDALDRDVRRADRGDQPEEHEHEHLAEPEVAVGLRAAGVEPGGERSPPAPTSEQPPRRRRRQRQPGDARRRRRQPNAARLTAPRAAPCPTPTSRIGPTRTSSVPRTPSL